MFDIPAVTVDVNADIPAIITDCAMLKADDIAFTIHDATELNKLEIRE